MDLETKLIHIARSMRKGKSPKNGLMRPSNFEDDGLHLNLLKIIQFLGSSSFVIHITYYNKDANFSKFVTWPKWSRNTKLRVFFSLTAPRTKTMFICQADLTNVVRLTPNSHNKNTRWSSSHPYNRISKIHTLICYITQVVSTDAGIAWKWSVKAWTLRG